MEEIPLLPDIPERLRIASTQGILVPFIGAGVSQLGGYPGWDDFATSALRFFVGVGKLDHAQFDQLARLSARVKLSLAVGLEQQYGTRIDYKSILQPTAANGAVADRAYGYLSELARIFVTTNYDELLDSAKSVALTPAAEGSPTHLGISRRTVHCRDGQFDIPSLSVPNTVFHIHGSVQDHESMILTTSDYLRRYASHRLKGDNVEENSFLTFLDHLFSVKSVLFIGYSLSELEILEFVIQKARGVASAKESNEEPRHFMLQGFFSHEMALMRSLRDYYLNECGIRLLPFSKDQRGWHQLIDVIEYLATEIRVGALQVSARLREMEGLLE